MEQSPVLIWGRAAGNSRGHCHSTWARSDLLLYGMQCWWSTPKQWPLWTPSRVVAETHADRNLGKEAGSNPRRSDNQENSKKLKGVHGITHRDYSGLASSLYIHGTNSEHMAKGTWRREPDFDHNPITWSGTRLFASRHDHKATAIQWPHNSSANLAVHPQKIKKMHLVRNITWHL